MKYIAQFFSYLFHPLLIPTYATYLFIYLGEYYFMLTDKGKIIILMIVFLSTFLLPVLFIPLFLYLKLINSAFMVNSRERLLPLMVTFILFYSGYNFLNDMPLPSFYLSFMLSAIVIIAFVFIISVWWKISAHMSALGGLSAGIIAFSILSQNDFRPAIMICLLVSGILAGSRLYLQAHSPLQVISGWALGFITTFILMFIR